MPTATIQVAAVTSPDQWSLGAGANKVVAVNAPSDDDASYITTNETGRTEQYSLATSSIPAGSTVNSVSVFSRCYSEVTTARVQTKLILGANSTLGAINVLTTSYANLTEVLARPGGGSWVLSDFATLQLAILTYNNGSRIPHCTSLWLIVDYTPPANTGQFFQLFR